MKKINPDKKNRLEASAAFGRGRPQNMAARAYSGSMKATRNPTIINIIASPLSPMNLLSRASSTSWP